MAKKGQTSRKGAPSKKPEEESKGSHALTLRKIEVVEKLGKYLIFSGCVVASLYVGIYLPIDAASGQTTTISYVVDFLAKVKADVVISWVATAGASGWAYRERRKRVIERKSKDERIKKLEEKLDPKRTSSNLTPDGETTHD